MRSFIVSGSLLVAVACTEEGSVTPGSGPGEDDLCADVVCAALSQCHVAGVCDPDTGRCTNPTARDGLVCDDGDACTYGDRCEDGACLPRGDVVCRPLDACHLAGTCDSATGCSNPVAPDDTACGDNNACTTGDHCVAGECVGTPVTCQAVDACHEVGVCNPGTGRCTTPPKPDGAACDTDNPNQCVIGACDGGECVSSPVVCEPIDDCHEAGVCNPDTGLCSTPNKVDGSPCEDGNLCTENDNCQSGVCVTGPPVTCQPADQCHDAGVCDPETGCSNPRKADLTSCEDGNLCTLTDVCLAGTCVGSDPKICTPLDQCHITGVCNPVTGLCSNPPIEDGVPCDDGNQCTSGTICQDGSCEGGDDIVCEPIDDCHLAGVCDPVTGCSNPVADDGTGCDDGDPCSQTDLCVDGGCVGTNPVVCTPENQCFQAGVCYTNLDGEAECTNPHKAWGTPCDDGNACTLLDNCQAGSCEGGIDVVCSEPCLESSGQTCNPSTGACEGTAVADDTGCDDGDPCTLTTTCQSGVCESQSDVTCTAIGGGCHAVGVCDPASGDCTNPTDPGTCGSGPRFTDVTSSYGIDWRNPAGSSNLGANVAVFDFDNDGLLDILLVGEGGVLGLFRNRGGDFEDRLATSGLPISLGVGEELMNVAVGDYDNDGAADLYLVIHGEDRLYQNDGAGAFSNVTDSAGLLRDQWSASAAFGDFDRDGDLDLYVGNYVSGWSPLTSIANELWLNDGDGTFTDVTATYGSDIGGTAGTGATVAVLWSDYDADGWPDLFVCNDFGVSLQTSQVFHNNGANAAGAADFFDVGTSVLGVDAAEYCQGLAVGDYDGDLGLDYYVANVGANLLLTNGGTTFSEDAATAGATVETTDCSTDPVASWGVAFIDIDRDCSPDVFVANGNFSESAAPTNALYPPNSLLHQSAGSFTDIGLCSGLGDPRTGRGVAQGDLDSDGDVDLVLANLDGSAVVYHNSADTQNSNGWLEVRTYGRMSNSDGYGTRIELDAGGCTGVAEVASSRVYFGLGSESEALVELTWPTPMPTGAITQRFVHVASRSVLVAVEPAVTIDSATGPGSPVAEETEIVLDLVLANHFGTAVAADYVVDVWQGGFPAGWGSVGVSTSVPANGTASVQVAFAVPDGAAAGGTDIELVTTVSDSDGGVDQLITAAQIEP